MLRGREGEEEGQKKIDFYFWVASLEETRRKALSRWFCFSHFRARRSIENEISIRVFLLLSFPFSALFSRSLYLVARSQRPGLVRPSASRDWREQ